ncbi:MAG: insulinase family protein [Desulfobacterales bacterium]|nr:insulinase family protein [Desulfobacterales bacterium]
MTEAVAKTTLKNGVRIVTRRIEHVRSVSMGVWVDAGARDEAPSEAGLSHFIEHMLFKGTEKRSSYDIAKAFDAIGGQTNAFTSMENTCYHARAMDEHMGIMAGLLSDIFLNSTFDEEELESERPVILSEIGMVEDNPEDYIHTLLEGQFWGSHPLGRNILGERDKIQGYTRDDLVKFFNHLYQPGKVVISCAGNVNHDEIVSLIAPAFEGIEAKEGFAERVVATPQSGLTCLSRPIEQTHVSLSWPGLAVTHEMRFASSLMNTILGGNMSSRLFQEIREKRGLAYNVYSFTASYVDAGMAGIYAGVMPETLIQCLEVTRGILEELCDKGVDETTLAEAKAFTKGNILLASESVDSQMARLASSEFHFGRQIPLDEVTQRIEAVTIQDIQKVAQMAFSHKPAVAVLGPNPDEEKIGQVFA